MTFGCASEEEGKRITNVVDRGPARVLSPITPVGAAGVTGARGPTPLGLACPA
jgi:hypothetical protein